ncbi:hypothetical protein M231_03026 [Tremella mesenterica]|uniref:Uncharacterized protein n=1 Tax=Tremella mesenterica TaxID=5217 RepID=A0A4Q1BPI0_TREME|nr:uncharacterized protein TREMEDRAFT_65355 [Tremella mesenterica DSM 1558]EIW66493.1 hypothetical protein TREMEDRAFT_65355 [Tremella mesenterica DSM 1558]RXK39672.1 hypothetical protein M231_03026 [Tremella mesenterica]
MRTPDTSHRDRRRKWQERRASIVGAGSHRPMWSSPLREFMAATPRPKKDDIAKDGARLPGDEDGNLSDFQNMSSHAAPPSSVFKDEDQLDTEAIHQILELFRPWISKHETSAVKPWRKSLAG